MAIYKVQDNGKAQKGLKAGDEVVTGGGTYKITGVNADGSYKSEKINDTTTSTYTGGYANQGSSGNSQNTGVSTGTSVGGSSGRSQYTGSSTAIKTNNNTQQAIKDKMNANSIKWHTADDAEKARLHAENEMLASMLGAGITYDPESGTWSGTADGGVSTGTAAKPTYTDKYTDEISAKLDAILNRDKFSYNISEDPLYQQYADMYRREGDRAMRETLAEAAAGAGGMNTYAITAAQQANNYYNSQLNDKIPELYQLAYDMYLNEIDTQVRDLGLLQTMSDSAYNRYQDTMAEWRDDRNFAYNKYRDQIADNQWQQNFDFNKEQADISNSQWQQNFDFNKEQADISNSQWQQSFDYNAGRDDIGDSRYDKETAYNRAMDLIGSGVMPSSTLLETAEISPEEANALISIVTAKTAKGTSSGGGSSKSSGGSGGYTGGNNGETEVDTSDYTLNNFTVGNRVYVDGIGHVSYQDLLAMRENGTVIEEKDSKNKTLFYRKA